MSKKLRLKTALAGILFLPIISAVNAGTITGEVKFVDTPPKLAMVKVTKDQDYCGETLPNETYLIDSNGGLRNVVVFLETAPATTAADPQKLNVIENSGCRYAPRILVMQKGERLKVRNADPKLHIPHSYLQERTVFMLSLPFRNTILDATQKIREPGILKLVCDTHAWMLGYVHVFDHHFFAVTDERGAFSITNIPAGTYNLKAWHEDAGIKSQEITILENGDARVTFEFGKK
ncbi:MAG TPA: carboxypeptidase regulatory-like domain-containing protein [Methylomirabilota bacterium]|nr:carboxypeptidase regulatory-like domain-containing protein [Methylomirabilota bacterium]